MDYSPNKQAGQQGSPSPQKDGSAHDTVSGKSALHRAAEAINEMNFDILKLERDLTDSRRWGAGCEEVIQGLRKEADTTVRELRGVTKAYASITLERDMFKREMEATRGLNRIDESTIAALRRELATALRERDALRDRPAVIGNSGKQEQLRNQAQAWEAVHNQLYTRAGNFIDPKLPLTCGRNEAVSMIVELQRKAAILDRINAGDFR